VPAQKYLRARLFTLKNHPTRAFCSVHEKHNADSCNARTGKMQLSGNAKLGAVEQLADSDAGNRMVATIISKSIIGIMKPANRIGQWGRQSEFNLRGKRHFSHQCTDGPDLHHTVSLAPVDHLAGRRASGADLARLGHQLFFGVNNRSLRARLDDSYQWRSHQRRLNRNQPVPRLLLPPAPILISKVACKGNLFTERAHIAKNRNGASCRIWSDLVRP